MTLTESIDDIVAQAAGLLSPPDMSDWAPDPSHPDPDKAEAEESERRSRARLDAYLADQSAIRWLIRQFPDRYLDGGFGWKPNSYASAVKPGDPIWLNWVNTVYKEAMMGVDFNYFADSYRKWFGIELPTPTVGYPSEFA